MYPSDTVSYDKIRILYDISVSDTIYDTYIDRIFEKQNLGLTKIYANCPILVLKVDTMQSKRRRIQPNFLNAFLSAHVDANSG